MISVANDLLNNSPGLCRTDGRPNTYADGCSLVDSHTLVHVSVHSYAYIFKYLKRIHTHSRGPPSPSPAVDTRGASRQRRPSFPDTAVQPARYQNGEQK